MNQILSWAFDKLKVANPVIALILGGLLVAAFYVLEYLTSNGVVLAPWLLSVAPYLKALIVALGLGLNPSTAAFRNAPRKVPTGGLMVLFVLFAFGLYGQARIQVNQNVRNGRFSYEVYDIKGNFLGATNELPKQSFDNAKSQFLSNLFNFSGYTTTDVLTYKKIKGPFGDLILTTVPIEARSNYNIEEVMASKLGTLSGLRRMPDKKDFPYLERNYLNKQIALSAEVKKVKRARLDMITTTNALKRATKKMDSLIVIKGGGLESIPDPYGCDELPDWSVDNWDRPCDDLFPITINPTGANGENQFCFKYNGVKIFQPDTIPPLLALVAVMNSNAGDWVYDASSNTKRLIDFNGKHIAWAKLPVGAVVNQDLGNAIEALKQKRSVLVGGSAVGTIQGSLGSLRLKFGRMVDNDFLVKRFTY
jgi:hypothetical protein